MSEIKVNQVSPRVASGTVTFGASGDSLSVPSGVTLTVASGATITNNGSANGFGLQEFDKWYLTSDVQGATATNTLLTAFTQDTRDGSITKGSGLTNSSGTWSFPSTGFWLLICEGQYISSSGISAYGGLNIHFTTDDSTYNERASGYNNSGGTGYYGHATVTHIFDVTSTSTHKFKFYAKNSSGNFLLKATYSSLTAIKISDT